MEIAAAAKVLFQHPNTVRYRLSKIQRIIGMEDDPLFAPMLSLTVSLSRILAEGQVLTGETHGNENEARRCGAPF